MKEILYDWGGLNVWLFHAINNLRGSAIDGFMRLGTALGDHNQFALYLALIALGGLIHLSRSPVHPPAQAVAWFSVMATLCLAYVADAYLVTWLKQGLDFPRPPLALPPDAMHVLGKPELHHSLPSGHATFAMTVVASLWPLSNPKGRFALAAFVLWVGLSRVSLGMHFPADVVAGYLLGLLAVLVTRFLVARISRAAVHRQDQYP